MRDFKRQAEKVFTELVMLEDKWDKLDDKERELAEQLAEETGLDELGDLEEVVGKFKQFFLQAQNTTVIDGYQVYIDNHRRLHIVLENGEYITSKLTDIKNMINPDYPKPIAKDTMMKIIDWYLRSDR